MQAEAVSNEGNHYYTYWQAFLNFDFLKKVMENCTGKAPKMYQKNTRNEPKCTEKVPERIVPEMYTTDDKSLAVQGKVFNLQINALYWFLYIIYTLAAACSSLDSHHQPNEINNL